mmetsp:Transcript_22418/g.48966  ORF Transcript_22418/g.48966 Transcript_22418/m.48966 type:complete len:213 (+) Transcript_22418:1176-1814(+)
MISAFASNNEIMQSSFSIWTALCKGVSPPTSSAVVLTSALCCTNQFTTSFHPSIAAILTPVWPPESVELMEIPLSKARFRASVSAVMQAVKKVALVGANLSFTLIPCFLFISSTSLTANCMTRLKSSLTWANSALMVAMESFSPAAFAARSCSCSERILASRAPASPSKQASSPASSFSRTLSSSNLNSSSWALSCFRWAGSVSFVSCVATC